MEFVIIAFLAAVNYFIGCKAVLIKRFITILLHFCVVISNSTFTLFIMVGTTRLWYALRTAALWDATFFNVSWCKWRWTFLNDAARYDNPAKDHHSFFFRLRALHTQCLFYVDRCPERCIMFMCTFSSVIYMYEYKLDQGLIPVVWNLLI